MSTTDDRLSELRQQLSEAAKRLGELEVTSVEAIIEGKAERDVSALEVRKAQVRDCVVLLQKTIRELEHRIQLAAQQAMLDHTLAVVAPLTKALDDAAAALALPPYDKPMNPLEPEVVPAKKAGRWFGNPKQSGGSRWNERAR